MHNFIVIPVLVLVLVLHIDVLLIVPSEAGVHSGLPCEVYAWFVF